ncbi:MAG: hypothetical protein LBQ83_00920, partial [Candidatus Margulisbacteria bacterium]|nr:hypothetical protein [Candidatus Margulisiibacteriota bacterium]
MHFWQDKNINGEASANEKKATFTAILADVRKYRKDNENEPPKAIHKKAVAMTEAERTSNRLYNRLGFLNRKIKEDEKYLDGPGYSAEEKVELLNILEGMFKDSDILADVRKYRKDNGNKLPEYIHKKAVAMTGTERTSNRLYARLNLLNRKIKKDEKYLDELGYSAEEKAELLNILKGTFAVIVQRNAKIIALIDKWMLENNKQKDGQPFSSIDEFIQYLRGNPGYEAKTPRKITKYGGENIGGWINTLRQGKNSSVEESEKKHLRDLRIYTEAESQEARNKIILSLIDEWMLENNKQKNGQ